jgi:hypothetical protein
MNTKTVALVYAIGFALAGVAGFFAAPPPPDAPPLILEHGHGLALGMLPVNTLHNVVHLLFALLALAAWAGGWARRYFQLVAVVYAVLIVMGLSSLTNTAFGLVPLWGSDVVLHLIVAAPAAYFGFARSGVDVRGHHGMPHRA